jgi:hypothetical protein
MVLLLIGTLVIGISIGRFTAKNVASSEIGNSYRALNEVTWAMRSAAERDDCALLKKQAILVHERWSGIRFLREDQISPESSPEKLVVEIWELK